MNPDQLAAIVRTLLEQGFALPILWVFVAVNGSIIAGRYLAGDDTLETEFLAQHVEGGTLELPINVMFVDRRGDAARVTIESDRVVYN